MEYTSQIVDFIKYTDGRGVDSIVEYYYATATEDATIPNVGSSDWKSTIKASGHGPDKRYLWNYEKINYSYGNPGYTTPAIISTRAAEIDKIYEFYQLNNSDQIPTTLPTTTNRNGWSLLKTDITSIPVPTTTNRYLWNYEIITYKGDLNDNPNETSGPACISAHGEKGRSILTTTINHAKTSSLVDPKDIGEQTETNPNGWAVRLPTVGENEYLWTRTIIDYDDDTPDTVSYSYMYQGKTVKGDSITVKSIEYQVGNSATTAPTGTWYKYDEMPEASQGAFLWTKTTFSDDSVAYSVSYQSLDGDPAQDFNITASSYALMKTSSTATSYKNSIIATAHKMNITGNVQWRKGSLTSSVLATGDSYTITSPGTYYASCGNWTDSITIAEVIDGEKGDNGDPAISVILTNPTMTFHKETSGESEECKVIVYEGGSTLTYASSLSNSKFNISNLSNCSQKNGSPDTIVIGDQTSDGSASFTVNVRSKTGINTSHRMTVYWKVVQNGINGTNGNTPYIKNGYWWIGDTNLNIKAEGTNGDTPYIKDGYWWIGSTNLNIKAEGKDGDTVKTIYAYYRQNNSTPPTKPNNGGNLPSGWSFNPWDATINEPFVFVSQCTVTNNSYGSWTNPTCWAKYGKDGRDGTDASVTDINVFNALTSNGTKFGCFYNENGVLYINAQYLKSGTVESDLILSGHIVAQNIDAEKGTVGGWNITPGRLAKDNIALIADNSETFMSPINQQFSPIRLKSGERDGYNIRTDTVTVTVSMSGEVSQIIYNNYTYHGNSYGSGELIGEGYNFVYTTNSNFQVELSGDEAATVKIFTSEVATTVTFDIVQGILGINPNIKTPNFLLLDDGSLLIQALHLGPAQCPIVLASNQYGISFQNKSLNISSWNTGLNNSFQGTEFRINNEAKKSFVTIRTNSSSSTLISEGLFFMRQYSGTDKYSAITPATTSFVNNNNKGNLYFNNILYTQSSTSDVRLKHSIELLPQEYDIFFDKLRPTRYKYIDGTSNRYHTGFIAQEVVQSLEESNLTTQDFAAVVLQEPGTENELWQLRRDEFVALNTWQIQLLKPRITAAEEKIAQLELEISSLKSELENLKKF